MQTFDAAGVRVTVHPDGLVEFDYGDMPVVDASQANHTLQAAETALAERGCAVPVPTLVRVGAVGHVTREARQIFAKGEVNRRLASRVALLTQNPVARLMGNFFLGFNRSDRPTRLFEDPQDALVWLRTPPA